jgi:hypothetical protein
MAFFLVTAVKTSNPTGMMRIPQRYIGKRLAEHVIKRGFLAFIAAKHI